MWGWILGAVVLGVAGVGYLQHRAQRGIYRPLASRQPARPEPQETPLGFEALDLREVARTSRRNESLERGHTSWTRRGFGLLGASADTHVEPLADDETYAARFHAAFHKDKSKD